MVRRLPFVADQCLHVSEELSDPILVGSEAWYCWLAAEQHQSFAFCNQLGSFTVRRERRRQHAYWYLYHKQEGKLRKTYLGKSEEMSLERLNSVAAKMVVQGDLHADAHARELAAGRTAEVSDEVTFALQARHSLAAWMVMEPGQDALLAPSDLSLGQLRAPFSRFTPLPPFS